MTGLEPATSLFDYAQGREEEEPLGIDYIQADLSTWRDERRFDIVIANMVLMDIPDFGVQEFTHVEVLGQTDSTEGLKAPHGARDPHDQPPILASPLGPSGENGLWATSQ